MKTKLLQVAISAFLLTGCSAVMKEAVSKRAPFDMNCDPASITIHELGDRTYGVSGCDKRATYIVQGACDGMGSGGGCVAVMNTDLNKDN